ncbi:MAG: YdgA family protein, partial [Azoarcus sp.]|nr:YdgA family protein [Azoarcus sp.]
EQAALIVAQEQSVKLLQRQPVLSIKDASAHWAEGDVALNFRISYVGTGDIATVAEIDATKIAADWQLSLPRTLAGRLAGEQMYEDELEANAFDDGESEGEGEDEPVRKPTKEQIDQHIAGMIDGGILVEKDGMLSLDAVLREGELKLNGKAAPLESLLGLSPF